MTDQPTTPRTGRPHVPGYGIPDAVEGALPWAWAEERLAAADTYWVGTTRPDGRPHLMPIWAAWLDGRVWMEGGAATRRARNIEANAAVTVGLQLEGFGAVVVEGTGRADPAHRRGPRRPPRRGVREVRGTAGLLRGRPGQLARPRRRDLGGHAAGGVRLVVVPAGRDPLDVRRGLIAARRGPARA